VTVVIEFQQQFLYVSLSESEARAMVISETKGKPELEGRSRGLRDEGKNVKGVQGDVGGR
jgi:hypothetical protein